MIGFDEFDRMINKLFDMAILRDMGIDIDLVLIEGIKAELRVYFPVSLEGFCEIEHYCYYLDFGKGCDSYESILEFYERLLGNGKG